MSDLQLGLLAIGLAVVAAVIAYNKWQEIQFRRQAEREFRSRHSDVLLGTNGSAGDKPRAKTESRTAEDRIEPVLEEPQRAENDSGASQHAAPERRTASSGNGVGLSEAIDFLVDIRASEKFPGRGLIEGAVRFLADSPKMIHLEGYVQETGQWEVLQHDRSYQRARAGLQLVDRRGAVHERDLHSFVEAVAKLAHEAGAAVQAEDTAAALARAEGLDKFCGDVDIQVAVHIAGKDFAGTKIRALSEAAGFTLDEDGRFRRRDDENRVLFVMANDEATPFSPDGMKSLVTSSVSLELDVPRAPGGSRAFSQFREIAEQFAGALGGTIVDDRRSRLTPASFDRIGEQLESVRKDMDAHGVRAGGALALRLFS